MEEEEEEAGFQVELDQPFSSLLMPIGFIYKGMEDLLMRGRREMKPLLFKLSIALALSVAGYFVSNLRSHPRPPSASGAGAEVGGRATAAGGGGSGLKDELHLLKSEEALAKIMSGTSTTTTTTIVSQSPSSKSFGDEEGFLLPEFNDLVLNEFEATGRDSETSTAAPSPENLETKQMAMEQEISNLRSLVRSLRERERNLEIQLLEYYGLKEQESTVRELMNRLKIYAVEAKLFTLKIESLQADNRRLQTQVSDHSRIMAELESARAKIKLLKRKLRLYEEQAKGKIAAFQQRIAAMQDGEHTDGEDDGEIEKKLKRLKDLEDEAAELRTANLRLAQENSEFALELASTQIRTSSVLESPEAEVLEEANHLREVNDKLTKEIEQLQTDRCADVEELVYLRWVNACLRYELRNYQAPPGKTVARDLSKTLSPKSEEKAKQLILEYANSGIEEKSMNLMDFDVECCSSSQASTGESDDIPNDFSPTTKNSGSTKSKFFSKLKKLVLGKDNHNNRVSSADRTPTSRGNNSERRASVSTGSFDDVIGRESYDSVSSCITVDHTPVNQKTGMQAQAHVQRRRTKVGRSQSMPRASLDFQKLRRLNLEDIKEGERCKSDVGTSNGYKRVASGEESLSGLSRNNLLDHDSIDSPEKFELMKFAEVLKSTRREAKFHRRSASSSFN